MKVRYVDADLKECKAGEHFIEEIIDEEEEDEEEE